MMRFICTSVNPAIAEIAECVDIRPNNVQEIWNLQLQIQLI